MKQKNIKNKKKKHLGYEGAYIYGGVFTNAVSVEL
jgi:hypothetical protein